MPDIKLPDTTVFTLRGALSNASFSNKDKIRVSCPDHPYHFFTINSITVQEAVPNRYGPDQEGYIDISISSKEINEIATSKAKKALTSLIDPTTT